MAVLGLAALTHRHSLLFLTLIPSKYLENKNCLTLESK